MTTVEKFITYTAGDGVIGYEAQKEVEPGKFLVMRVTESANGPGNVENVDQPNAGIEITEEDFMDAYFRVVCAAMEVEYVVDREMSPTFEVRPDGDGFRVYNIAENKHMTHICPKEVAEEICDDFNKMSTGDYRPLLKYDDQS